MIESDTPAAHGVDPALDVPTAPEYPSLRRSFSWTLAGNVAYAGSQWAMLVLLARLGPPAMVGLYALGLTIATPVVTFALLQLRQLLATDSRRELDFRHYRDLRAVGMAFAVAATALIAALGGYGTYAAAVILGVAATKVFDGISDVYWGLLQHDERMDVIAKSLIVRNLASVVALGAGVHLSDSLLIGVIASAACSLLTLVVYDIRNAALRTLRRRDETRDSHQVVARGDAMRRLLGRGVPLGAATMLIALNVSVPRFFLERYDGTAELGIFAAIASLFVAGTTIVTALGDSASPRLARHFGNGERTEFKRLLVKLLAFATGLGVIGLLLSWAIGGPVLELLYGATYADHLDVLMWMMVAAGFNYLAAFCGYATTALRLFKIQPVLIAVATLVGAIASIALIPTHGILGAAWASILSFATQFAGALGTTIYGLSSRRRPT